jgi:hypothetical protein
MREGLRKTTTQLNLLADLKNTKAVVPKSPPRGSVKWILGILKMMLGELDWNACFRVCMWLLFKRWACFWFRRLLFSVKRSDIRGEGTMLITKALDCFKVDADLIARREICQLVGRFYGIWPIPNAEAGKWQKIFPRLMWVKYYTKTFSSR